MLQPVETDKDDRRERKRQEGQEREFRKVELARLREEVPPGFCLGHDDDSGCFSFLVTADCAYGSPIC